MSIHSGTKMAKQVVGCGGHGRCHRSHNMPIRPMRPGIILPIILTTWKTLKNFIHGD